MLGVANQNPLSAKIVSAKCLKKPIHENCVPQKFGAIQYCIMHPLAMYLRSLLKWGPGGRGGGV